MLPARGVTDRSPIRSRWSRNASDLVEEVGPARPGPAQHDSARRGPARLGSAWLSSAVPGQARLGSPGSSQVGVLCTRNRIIRKIYVVSRRRNDISAKPPPHQIPLSRKKHVLRARDTFCFGLADLFMNTDLENRDFTKRFDTFFWKIHVSRAREANF